MNSLCSDAVIVNETNDNWTRMEKSCFHKRISELMAHAPGTFNFIIPVSLNEYCSKAHWAWRKLYGRLVGLRTLDILFCKILKAKLDQQMP
jgi:cyclopropane-fatty-acyl-phospholipid synthase